MTQESMLKEVQKDTYRWLTTGFGTIRALSDSQLAIKMQLINKLLIEEYKEYLDALAIGDKLGQLNAISDLLFVVNNIPFFQKSSSYTEWPLVTERLYSLNTKRVFNPKDLDYNLAMKFINTVIKYSGFSYYDIYNENKATYQSNMTKYCKSEGEAKKSVEMYRNGTHPNKPNEIIECEYLYTGVHSHPYRIQDNDGKIMKSHLFLDVECFR